MGKGKVRQSSVGLVITLDTVVLKINRLEPTWCSPVDEKKRKRSKQVKKPEAKGYTKSTVYTFDVGKVIETHQAFNA
jgi:hypothetical protein